MEDDDSEGVFIFLLEDFDVMIELEDELEEGGVISVVTDDVASVEGEKEDLSFVEGSLIGVTIGGDFFTVLVGTKGFDDDGFVFGDGLVGDFGEKSGRVCGGV